MNQYDTLSLMDTYKALKNEGVDVPNTFQDFLAGVRPINSNDTNGKLQPRR